MSGVNRNFFLIRFTHDSSDVAMISFTTLSGTVFVDNVSTLVCNISMIYI